jgi:hypothetical protein
MEIELEYLVVGYNGVNLWFGMLLFLASAHEPRMKRRGDGLKMYYRPDSCPKLERG